MGIIRFDHVRFSYAPEIPLLEDICFTVPAGKMYAIVSPSGSGKSTVVNLIPRLFDVTSGVITESGDHESLLAQDGIYRELYETQFRKVLEYETETHPLPDKAVPEDSKAERIG